MLKKREVFFVKNVQSFGRTIPLSVYCAANELRIIDPQKSKPSYPIDALRIPENNFFKISRPSSRNEVKNEIQKPQSADAASESRFFKLQNKIAAEELNQCKSTFSKKLIGANPHLLKEKLQPAFTLGNNIPMWKLDREKVKIAGELTEQQKQKFSNQLRKSFNGNVDSGDTFKFQYTPEQNQPNQSQIPTDNYQQYIPSNPQQPQSSPMLYNPIQTSYRVWNQSETFHKGVAYALIPSPDAPHPPGIASQALDLVSKHVIQQTLPVNNSLFPHLVKKPLYQQPLPQGSLGLFCKDNKLHNDRMINDQLIAKEIVERAELAQEQEEEQERRDELRQQQEIADMDQMWREREQQGNNPDELDKNKKERIMKAMVKKYQRIDGSIRVGGKEKGLLDVQNQLSNSQTLFPSDLSQETKILKDIQHQKPITYKDLIANRSKQQSNIRFKGIPRTTLSQIGMLGTQSLPLRGDKEKLIKEKLRLSMTSTNTSDSQNDQFQPNQDLAGNGQVISIDAHYQPYQDSNQVIITAPSSSIQSLQGPQSIAQVNASPIPLPLTILQ
ncbi:MAG: hypothetical protein EZS28_016106 [Streblomastix strix]|uniref:Uncharacterized protein n=1 Tax=Streblomastix strix TaxID=222440 RepID=A0A5J4W154_9EUKA|nr:MAG: hypothetical protein EZS28_016106 [Streblomastix strix]